MYVFSEVKQDSYQVSRDILSLFANLELLCCVECLHHLVGIKTIKRHLFINMLIQGSIVHLCLYFYETPEAILTYYVLLRCCARLTRHLYNAYLSLDLKFEHYWVDYLRMTSFYFFYVAQYLCSFVIVVTLLPSIRHSNMGLEMMPNKLNFDVDVSLLYIMGLFASVPHFVSTCIYLHQKRQQQLYSLYGLK